MTWRSPSPVSPRLKRQRMSESEYDVSTPPGIVGGDEDQSQVLTENEGEESPVEEYDAAAWFSWTAPVRSDEYWMNWGPPLSSDELASGGHIPSADYVDLTSERGIGSTASADGGRPARGRQLALQPMRQRSKAKPRPSASPFYQSIAGGAPSLDAGTAAASSSRERDAANRPLEGKGPPSN